MRIYIYVLNLRCCRGLSQSQVQEGNPINLHMQLILAWGTSESIWNDLPRVLIDSSPLLPKKNANSLLPFLLCDFGQSKKILPKTSRLSRMSVYLKVVSLIASRNYLESASLGSSLRRARGRRLDGDLKQTRPHVVTLGKTVMYHLRLGNVPSIWCRDLKKSLWKALFWPSGCNILTKSSSCNICVTLVLWSYDGFNQKLQIINDPGKLQRTTGRVKDLKWSVDFLVDSWRFKAYRCSSQWVEDSDTSILHNYSQLILYNIDILIHFPFATSQFSWTFLWDQGNPSSLQEFWGLVKCRKRWRL